MEQRKKLALGSAALAVLLAFFPEVGTKVLVALQSLLNLIPQITIPA